jgi:putative spermidine/putrescine transport system substrate-binding protein
MTKHGRRVLFWGACALLIGVLAIVAAGCGGGGGGGQEEAGTEVEGLGSTIDEIKSKARDEGQVDLVIWPGYADKSWASQFTKQTGCKVVTKDGGTSDEMIDLISTGQYDGVSASGNASVRLMKRGDVAPVNTDLTPNFADVAEGLKNQDYNSLDGQAYGVPHGRGPNLLMWRTDVVKPAPTSWSAIWNKNTPYKKKISIYDDSIFIADAALYLKATKPDLGIENPYQLNDEQFAAAVNLLKGLKPNVGEWWADYAKQIQSFANKDVVIGTTWPYQQNILKGDKKPVQAIKPK